MTLSANTPSPSRDTSAAKICVFCGSSEGKDPAFAAAAEETGRRLADAGFDMVFGGGDIGLMGQTARAVRAGGRGVRGILPDFLSHLEPPMTRGETVEFTADLQERKRRMLELGDAFVILPGGLGTLDEFFEVLTSAQLGALAKPILVLDTHGFYAPLKALLQHVIDAGFAKPDARDLCRFVATPQQVIEALREAFAEEG